MKLKAWIDEIKTTEKGKKSEALLEQAGAPDNGFLPGEKQADEILFSARDEIISGGVFHFTKETQAAETEVNKSYKAILNGSSDFEALCESCANWVKAARTKPAPPVMAPLFPGVKI